MPLDISKKIVVTGAAGFIGFHLSRRLLEAGFKVSGFDNLNAYYDVSLKEARLKLLSEYKAFDFTRGDLADKEGVEKLFIKARPDIVVNLAAQAGVRYSIENPEAYISSNINGFFNILEACRKHGIEHLVYASSSSVYGANKKVPFSTQDRTDHPVSLYAATKKSNELMAYTYSHLFGIPATGLRFFTVYGPYGRPDMAYFSFTQKILKGDSIKIFNNGDMYRDFTYVDDIVEGIVKLLGSPPEAGENAAPHKVYNIGNHSPEKLMYFIEVLEKALSRKASELSGKDIDIRAKKEFLPMQAGDVPATYADVDDLVRDFDFKPATSIEEGLNKFASWYFEYFRPDSAI